MLQPNLIMEGELIKISTSVNGNHCFLHIRAFINIGNIPSKSFYYSIRVQNQVVLASGTFDIKGNPTYGY